MAAPAPTPIDLYLLVIAPNSNMLVTGSGTNDIPMIPASSADHAMFPIDKAQIERILKIYFLRYPGLSIVVPNQSRFEICSSDPSSPFPTPGPTPIPTPIPTAPPATATSRFVAILHVDENEKNLIKTDSNFDFLETVKDATPPATGRVVNPRLALGPNSQAVFTNFNYLTYKGTSTLDVCISRAFKPTLPVPVPPTPSATPTTTVWTFYRPIFPNPLFFPNVYNPYVSPIGYESPRYSPSSSPRLYPRPSSERMVAPRVPRSPRSSPRMGGYKEKYIKYKAKYMKLKSELSNLNI